MPEADPIDYGPLAVLLGTWTGDRGIDVAPEPDGPAESPFYETIHIVPAVDLDNADEQELVSVQYRQVVHRKSNGKAFHDESGYWIWEPSSGLLMQALVLPRGVGLLAGGRHDGRAAADGSMLFEVAASKGGEWDIVESPFMRAKARTRSFSHRIVVRGDRMSYDETTMLEIYGREFEHTDRNELRRV
jgi:hypothetical protein